MMQGRINQMIDSSSFFTDIVHSSLTVKVPNFVYR